MMNNYAKFRGVMCSDIEEFNTALNKPAWSFRIKVDTGGKWLMTVHCIDYSGDFVQCKQGDIISIDGAITVKRRTVNDKMFFNLSVLHR